MDDFKQKVEELLKSLLSLKTGASKDLMVPAIKSPSLKTPSIKQPSAAKIPSALPPPSKKDPIKVAEQLKNPNPGKAKVEVLKIEDNGQWTLIKGKEDITQTAPNFNAKTADIKGVSSVPMTGRKSLMHSFKENTQPVRAQEGFKNYHSPDQKKLIHGLQLHRGIPMSGGHASGGAIQAPNPNAMDKYAVIKRASDHASQENRGHLKDGFNSAKREVLFHNMARDFFGMGKHVPTTAGFTRNGEDYSAQELKPTASHMDLKPKDDFLRENDNDRYALDKPSATSLEKDELKDPSHVETLNKLHESGALHKLALMDNIMGHHDRHAGNFMMDKGNKLHLIDNGTSFDYGNYDTLHYPDYLRHGEDKNIKGLGFDNSKIHPQAAEWLQKLDPQKAKELFAAHGHDENSPTTQGFLRRLQGMKNALNNGPEHYKNLNNLLDKNRLTTGPLYQHSDEATEKKW